MEHKRREKQTRETRETTAKQSGTKQKRVGRASLRRNGGEDSGAAPFGAGETKSEYKKERRNGGEDSGAAPFGAGETKSEYKKEQK
jgi:hypothetical protein